MGRKGKSKGGYMPQKLKGCTRMRSKAKYRMRTKQPRRPVTTRFDESIIGSGNKGCIYDRSGYTPDGSGTWRGEH